MTESMTESKKLQQVFLDTVCYGQSFYKKWRGGMLIGVTGRIGEGKTSVAEHLRDKHGFLLLSFSTPIKEAIAQLFGLPMTVLTNPVLKTQVIEEFGKSAREIMQIFGTECMRNHFGSDFWVNQMINRIDWYSHRDIVIDDVRFPEEAQMVHDYSGFLMRVIRPNNPYAADKVHTSEHLPGAFTNITMVNSDTLEALGAMTSIHIEHMGHEGESK